MKKYTTLAIITTITLSAQPVFARETVITTGISTGVDYSTRSYDTDSPASDISSVPTDMSADDNPLPPPEGMPSSRDDERTSVVIIPTISIISESSKDSALLNYSPSVSYDFSENETNDINHQASFGYQRDLTDFLDLKIYNSFKNTDEYETNRPEERSSINDYIEELISSIPTLDDSLRDDPGRRRYSRNELSLSTGFNYMETNRISLAYEWDHLEYDEDEYAIGSYQDYDKHRVSLALSHTLNQFWPARGYVQYVRGIFDTDDTSDNDLSEYHFGGTLETDIIQTHPITLSYDFSQTDYDDESIDISQIHTLTLGYKLLSSPLFEVDIGAGPTYTKLNDSETSWDANGILQISSKIGDGTLGLNTKMGTQFDNFSGTDEHTLTEYWQTRAEYNYPITTSLQTAIYSGYRNEIRNEINSYEEVDVEQISVGTVLKYNINENFDLRLNYDYTIQDSEVSEDNYDEHRLQFMLSYKTDLFSW